MKKSLILLMAAAALFATACNSGSKIGDYETVYNGYIYNAGEGENGPTGSISTLNLETGEVTPNGYLLANNADMDAHIVDAAMSYTQGVTYVVTNNPAQILSLAAVEVVSSTAPIKPLQKVIDPAVTDGLDNPVACQLYSNYLFVANNGAAETAIKVYNVSSMKPNLIGSYRVDAPIISMAIAGQTLGVTTEAGVVTYEISGESLHRNNLFVNEGVSGTPYGIAALNDEQFIVICKGNGLYTMKSNAGTPLSTIQIETGDKPMIATDYFISNRNTSTIDATVLLISTNVNGVGKVYQTLPRDLTFNDPVFVGGYISGLSINPDNGVVYIMDGTDEYSISRVHVYSNGAETKSFMAGSQAVKMLFINYMLKL